MAEDLKALPADIAQSDLYEYATDIADKRMNTVEREMQKHPELYPVYARAYEAREIQEQEFEEKYRCDPMDIDGLENAMNAVEVELALEMYKRGVLDGGRIYHAFVTGELPRKEDTHESQD